MLESVWSLLEELSRTVRIVDLIDILLVSVFLYAALVWFQRTASRGVLIGVAALTILYFLARGLDMYLTSLAFHTTFAILLFVLVVVFQEDIRRLLERLSAMRSVRTKQSERSVNLDLDSLCEAVFRMAATKTGALIVIRGREPLERHVNGGIQLNGRLSLPLLMSIFDSHTPGHDGAVIIDGDRVAQFAAHLPISQNSTEIAGRGTRHSAALGLSERSDAITVVVSEERGVVSVAEEAKLRRVRTASDLKNRLNDYLNETFPEVTQSLWNRVLIQHGHLKVVSLVVAMIAWFALAYDPHTVQRTFVVPIEYRNLPPALELDRSAPTESRVTISGSERHFRFLDPATLKVTLDLTGATTGYEEFGVSDRNIKVPANLSLYRIEPRVVRLYLAPANETPPAATPIGS